MNLPLHFKGKVTCFLRMCMHMETLPESCSYCDWGTSLVMANAPPSTAVVISYRHPGIKYEALHEWSLPILQM